MVLLAAASFAPAALAQIDATEPVCRVHILGNSVDQPGDSKDGTVLFRVYVSASTACREGLVEVAVYPDSVCRKRPTQDLNDSQTMAFQFEPRTLKVLVKPGGLGSGVVQITSGDSGSCSFNSHVARCDGVALGGGRCVARDLTDPRAQPQGSVEEVFNQLL